MDSKQRTAGPYSVVNGKLFRDGATARIEVKPSEARDMLNSLLQQRDELAAALIDLMAAANETRTAGIDNTGEAVSMARCPESVRGPG